MTRLSISLLGPLLVTLDGRPVGGFGYNKVRALLAYLAVEADRAHHRDALVGMLWPDQSDRAARTNLRQALATLREALGDAAAASPFLLTTRDTVQFNSESDHDLDVAVLETSLAECRTHRHRGLDRCLPCAARMEQAVARYRGDFLSQFSLPDSAPFEEWTLLNRERLRQDALEMLIHLATHQERRGDLDRAQRYVRRQVEMDPWREESHRKLMGLLGASGKRSAALAQYETCRRALAEGLGVEPAPETLALYEQIKTGELEPQKGSFLLNWPHPATPFFGREAEVGRLAELIGNPDSRLITILGPGGIGKTRLALQVAAEMLPVFAEGVCFVPLAPLSSPEFLPSAVVDALQCPGSNTEEPATRLLNFLGGREILLVLDGFEAILDGADFLSEIIRSAPKVTLLVTSQERLSLQAEWTFEAEGLSYPGQVAEDFETYSAVRLFIQRARMTKSDVLVSQDEALGIARICRLVEGLPLALELAAAGVSNLRCREIAEQLEHSLDSLAVRLRDVPARHRSMQAAFEYSWSRLSEAEQAVFRALSVFRGGFEIETAREVAGATAADLEALAGKSLVRIHRSGRYDLHELLRHCAEEKLEARASEARAIRQRHAGCFIKLAEAALSGLSGPGQAEWLERLDTEHDNLRAVLAWSTQPRERGENEGASSSDPGLQLAGSLWRYWEIRGHLAEGRRWLEALLANRSDRMAVNATALNAAGNLAFDQGDYPLAYAYFAEALAIWEAMGDQLGMASCLNNLGNVALYQGDYAAAKGRYEKCLAIRSELGDRKGRAKPLYNLGITTRRMGDFQAARDYLRESRKIYEELGDQRGCAGAIVGLGGVEGNLGDHAAARAHYEIGLETYRRLGDKRGIATCLQNLAQAAFRMGEQRVARDLLPQALQAYHELGDKRHISECLERTAEQLAQDHPLRAARLLAAAQNLREAIGAPRPPVDHADFRELLQTIRSGTDESSFTAAWADGQALTLEQAVDEALGSEEEGAAD